MELLGRPYPCPPQLIVFNSGVGDCGSFASRKSHPAGDVSVDAGTNHVTRPLMMCIILYEPINVASNAGVEVIEAGCDR